MTSIRWTIPETHPAFAGHFPGTPIMPGVALLDAVLHAITARQGAEHETCTINSVKFLSPAKPGDEIEIQYDASAGKTIHFDILTGTRKLASGNITLADGMAT